MANVFLSNPFGCGLKHQSLFVTETICGNEETGLSTGQKAGYYLGRAVNVLLIVPLALIDLPLKIIQNLVMTLELALVKGESLVRNAYLHQTKLYQAFSYFSLSKGIEMLRHVTTRKASLRLGKDIGIVSHGAHNISLSSKCYKDYLYSF